MQLEAKTILLLGNYRPSLIIAKILVKRGYKVVVGDKGCDGGCEHSRYVHAIWEHPEVKPNHSNLFFKSLKTFLQKNENVVGIFPVSEAYVRAFAQTYEDLSSFPPIISNDFQLIERCFDKPYMMNLALELDIPIAPFATSNGEEEFNHHQKSIGFPIVVRPADSTQRLNEKKALIIQNEGELQSDNFDVKIKTQQLLLQKQFQGTRHNLYFGALNGKIYRLSEAKILRTDQSDGTGLAVEGITIEPTKCLVNQTEKILQTLSYTGIGCIQFLVNEDNGDTCFLEINPRVAGNHAVPEAAGLQLGEFVLDLSFKAMRNPDIIFGKTNIKFSWLSAEIGSIKDTYLRGEIKPFEAISRLVNAVWKGSVANLHIVFSVSDPLPGIMALWKTLPRINRWKNKRTNKYKHSNAEMNNV